MDQANNKMMLRAQKAANSPPQPPDHTGSESEFRDIPVKFLGQIGIPPRRDGSHQDSGTECANVIEFLVEKSSRKEYRKGMPKDLLVSLSPIHGVLVAFPKGGGRSISVNLSRIEGLAMIGSKFSFLTDSDATGGFVVYAFQFKRKTDGEAFVAALERGTSAQRAPTRPSIASLTKDHRTSSVDNNLVLSVATQFNKQATNQPSNLSSPAINGADLTAAANGSAASGLSAGAATITASRVVGKSQGVAAAAAQNGANAQASPLVARLSSPRLVPMKGGSVQATPAPQQQQGQQPQQPAMDQGKVKQLEAKVKELEDLVVKEKASASAAEVAKLSSILRWVTAEKETSELKAELAEMKAEMAGLAAEMAADMAKVRANTTDEKTEQMLQELRQMKRGLEVINSRLPTANGGSSGSANAASANSRRRSEAAGAATNPPLWETTEKPASAEQKVTTTDSPAREHSAKLMNLVQRASSFDRSRIDVSGLLPPSAAALDTSSSNVSTFSAASKIIADFDPEKLAQASQAELIEVVKLLRAESQKVPGLEAKLSEVRAELMDAVNQNSSLMKQLEEARQSLENERNMFEMEKQLLANTIAGQQSGARGIAVLPLENSQEVIETIVIDKGSSGLGFSIAGGVDDPIEEGDSGVYVTSILENGAVAKDGRLQVGDKILSVNNNQFTGILHEEAVRVLQSTSQRVTLVVSRLILPAADVREEFETIQFQKSPQGLGFSIAGGTDNPVEPGDEYVYVTTVIPGGAAHADGRLRMGDRMVEVNGNSMEGITHAEAVRILQEVADVVTMTVARLPESMIQELELTNAPAEETLVIEFQKGETGLGFSIAGGSDNPVTVGDNSVYVTYIQANGSAHLDGRLEVGDRLLEVNGLNVQNVSHEEVIRALQQNPNGVRLVVSRLPAPVEETVEIAFEKGPGGLGFSIAGGTDDANEEGDAGIYVTQVIPGGSAHRDGRLQLGDRILQCNGHSLEEVTHEQAVRLLQSDPQQIQLLVSRLVDITKSLLGTDPHQQQAAARMSASAGNDTVDEGEVFVDVAFQKGSNGLGFSVAGGNDQCIADGDVGIYVTQIQPGGVAAGQLRFGDKLITVNGIDVTNVPHDVAVKALQSSTSVTMRVSRLHLSDETLNEEDAEATGEIKLDIEFARAANGLGFSIAGGADQPVEGDDPSVYVTHIVQGGAAQKDGRLCLGDKLLSVNGKSVINVPHAQVLDALKSSATCRLTVSRLAGDTDDTADFIED
eukprot:m.179328 g.179328  ORF g.179328 m.179328 type:complete len:1243 (+) comp17406_c0_seq6:229-3957(+)